MTPDQRPLLIFFTSLRSGQARRMESLLAHIARKERDRLRVSKVDVDERPDVSRLEGRATAPRIKSMLEPHLAAEQIAV